MQQPGSNDPNVGSVLQQLQRALQQQPLPRLGSLVTIGGPTVVVGASGGTRPKVDIELGTKKFSPVSTYLQLQGEDNKPS